jgi:hypothetical protein
MCIVFSLHHKQAHFLSFKVVESVLPVSRVQWITPRSADARVTLTKGAAHTSVLGVQLQGRFLLRMF